MTPYDKLKSLDNAERFLKPSVTFGQLDAIAHAVSDLDAANTLNDARNALFRAIARPDPHPTRTIRRLNHVPANPPPDQTRAVGLPLAAPFSPPLRLAWPIGSPQPSGRGPSRACAGPSFPSTSPFHSPTPQLRLRLLPPLPLQAHLRIGKDSEPSFPVILAKAGRQRESRDFAEVDSRFRGNDGLCPRSLCPRKRGAGSG